MLFDYSRAAAQTAIGAQFASGIHRGIERAEVGASFPTPFRGRVGVTEWAITLDVDFARWHASGGEGRTHLYDLGVTPQLRVFMGNEAVLQPFVDVGVGAHVLDARDLRERRLGTHFQFGEYVGLGIRTDERRQLALMVRVLHESNLGLARSNSGLTAVGLRLEYAFQ